MSKDKGNPDPHGVGFLKWTETERLYQIRRNFHNNEVKPRKMIAATIDYKCKIKLHGTNSGIRIMKDDVGFQGRNRNVGSINKGNFEDFFNFQEFGATFNYEAVRNSDFMVKSDYGEGTVASFIANGGHATVYGEWAGPGIQKDASCSKVPARFFAVFSIRIEDADGTLIDTIVEPELIARIIDAGNQPGNVYVLPWFKSDLQFDTKSADSGLLPDGDVWSICMTRDDAYQTAHDEIDAEVKVIEECDPFIKATFGIEGVGEGLVFYPRQTRYTDSSGADIVEGVDASYVTTYLFKVKGNKHMKGLKQKQPADLTRFKVMDAWLTKHLEPVWASHWNPDTYKDPQDIPDWRAVAGRATKEHLVKVFSDGKADNPEKYDWNAVKSRAGTLTVNYLKDQLGF